MPRSRHRPSIPSSRSGKRQARKCKTLDAELTVFHYDAVFGDPHHPVITQGRFYYEAPNLGCYEIRKYESAGFLVDDFVGADGNGHHEIRNREAAKNAANNWRNISEAIIWTGKETLWIEGPKRNCRKYSTAKIEAVLSRPESKNECLFGIIWAFSRQLACRLQGPRQIHPLLIGIPATEVRQRFDVTIERSGEDIQLKAVPKQQVDRGCFREIDVILNAKTFMTVATQEVLPSGRDRTVYQFSDAKVNQRPSDRDQLLAPDLSGLHVTEDDGGFLDPDEPKKKGSMHRIRGK